jgi:hypothetical protein
MCEKTNEVATEHEFPFHFLEKCYIIKVLIVGEKAHNDENCCVCVVPLQTKNPDEKCKIITASILHIKEIKTETPIDCGSEKGIALQNHINETLINPDNAVYSCIDCLPLLWILLDKKS